MILTIIESDLAKAEVTQARRLQAPPSSQLFLAWEGGDALMLLKWRRDSATPSL